VREDSVRRDTPNTYEALALLIMAYVSDNKCIGDDTKAAARRSPNCIKKTIKKYGENDFQYVGWNY